MATFGKRSERLVYEIIDGVHRSLTAWHLGNTAILALLATDSDDVEIEVSLNDIRSPRHSDNISLVSLCNYLNLRNCGTTLDPIQIFPGSRHVDPAEFA
jgi:hypothetical protein